MVSILRASGHTVGFMGDGINDAAAMKAADVTMVAFYGPPSETNFGGGLLTGSQSACKAACSAFAQAVQTVADYPKDFE